MQEKMEERFLAHLKSHFPELLQNPLIVACSGGLDSAVLAELCLAVGLQPELAHCHFGLRGEASDQDAVFVEAIAIKNDLKYHIKHFNTAEYIELNKQSLQEGARDLRYTWFDSLLQENSQHFLLTAHHADDQLETFLMHLGRGAGLHGLCGIPARKGRICRPLLPFLRSELEDYAAKRGLLWREDASNLSDTYLRNRYRHHVTPAIKAIAPDFIHSFLRSLEHLEGSRKILDLHIRELRQRLEIREESWLRYDIEALKGLKPLRPLLFELFRRYGFTDWDALEGLLDAMPGKEVHSSSHRLLRDRDCLLLKPVERNDTGVYTVSLTSENEHLPIPLAIESVEALGQTGPGILYVDKETLKGGLRLRKWREGDYFYPLGMKGRKLVSKFFKDLKFNQFQKESQWILLSGEAIVWLPGQRADDRFKVTGKTREILRIACIDPS